MSVTIAGTSRSGSPPEIAPSANRHAGIDTLRVRAPLARAPSLDHFDSVSTRRDPERGQVDAAGEVWLSRYPVRLHVELWRGAFAWFEHSLPNLVHGTNVIPLDVAEALRATEVVYMEALDFVDWAVAPEDMRVMRLDVDRDFRSDLPIRTILDAIGATRTLPYRARGGYWGNEEGFTSVVRGHGKRWLARLYDKSEEIASRARRTEDQAHKHRLLSEAAQAQGLLRFETRMRSPVLTEAGIARLGDLTDDRVTEVSKKFFQRAGYNEEVGSIDKIQAAAILMDPSEYKNLHKVIGVLAMEAMGLPPSPSENTHRSLKGVARRLGLSAADFSGRSDASFRLDFDAARVVSG